MIRVNILPRVVAAGILSGLVSAAGADTAATPAAAAPAAAEAQIPFANHGGIYNWQVVDNRTVLIQGQNRKWYKATLFSSCFDLPFAEKLGFESNADGSFDKFSSIRVRGQDCPLTSLVETTPPPKKVKAKKAAAPATTPSTGEAGAVAKPGPGAAAAAGGRQPCPPSAFCDMSGRADWERGEIVIKVSL